MANPLADILKLLGGLGGGGFGKSLSEMFMGTPERERQFQRFTPEQQAAQSQMLQRGLEGTDISGIEGLARKRFQEETIPSLAERFTSMGEGAQRSSAFESSLGRAGSDLEAQLAALRPQFGMQQLGIGMQPSFETALSPATPGLAQGGLQSLIAMLPMLLKLLG